MEEPPLEGVAGHVMEEPPLEGVAAHVRLTDLAGQYEFRWLGNDVRRLPCQFSTSMRTSSLALRSSTAMRSEIR